jgi:N-acetylglucosamine repressor
VSTDQTATRRATGTKVAHGMMREVNRSIVLDILREGHPISRVELARRTGLSKPTVSSIVEDLVGAGLVREVGIEPSAHRTGRPPSLLVYNERAVAFAGIQFGVSTTHVAIADGLGNLIATATVAAVHGDPDQSVRDARGALRVALTRSGVKRENLRAVGVAVPGMVDPHTGVCVLAPNIGWQDAPIRERVQSALRLPTVVANSTHAAAIAEARLHPAERGAMVWVYAGTGIGAGVVLDGALFTGPGGFAGELGHAPVEHSAIPCSCGNRGCLETVASGAAIVRRARELIADGCGGALRRHRREVTADLVARLAAEGDTAALTAIRDAGHELGRGIAYVVNLLSPSLIVLGGPLVMMSEAYVDAVRESVAQHALPQTSVPVTVTALGPHAPLLGVVQLAMDAATPSYRVVDHVRLG